MTLELIDLVREGPLVLPGTEGLSFSGRVVGGWAALLGRYRWDWFCTFTFVEEIHPEAADKVFRVWMSKLQQAVIGCRHYERHPQKQVRWARGLEWQKRGVLHYHALLYAPAPYVLNERQRRKDWESEWQQLTGAYSSIYPADSQEALRGYIAKYCGKGGEVDVCPNLPQAALGTVGLRR